MKFNNNSALCRVTIQLAVSSVVNVTCTDGTTPFTWGLRGSKIPAGKVKTFMFGVRASKDGTNTGDALTYDFEVETDGIIQQLLVEEVLGGVDFGFVPEAPVDPFLEMSRGNIDGTSSVNKFGRNPDCDSAASVTAVPIGRDIWDGGVGGATAWVPPTTARIHAIASSNDEDGGAGTDTGALTMRIYGLDSAFALQQEDVTLNGTTPVNTANTYTMLYRMLVLTAGSAGRNLGNITATAATDGTVTAQITIDNNQTLMAIYMIPAGVTGYMTNWHGDLLKTGGATKFADFHLMSMDFGGVWRVRSSASTGSDGANVFQQHIKPYKSFSAKSLIKVVSNPSADAQDIGAGFDLVLVDN